MSDAGRFYIEDFLSKNRWTEGLTFRKGRWRDTFRNTEEDFGKWVVDKVLEGGYESIADFARDILLDAYYEDREP